METIQPNPVRKIWKTLTDLQRKILTYVAMGCSDADIAKSVCTSHSSVAAILSRLYRKAGFDNRKGDINCRVLMAVYYHQLFPSTGNAMVRS